MTQQILVAELPDLEDRIRAYYHETYLDYRVAWCSRETLAMHFGYWDEDTRTHAEALLNLNREVARRMDLPAGSSVLDAGCGIGGSSLWLARHHRMRVTGITLTPSQLARALRASRESGVEASFHLDDFQQTRFPAGSFDAYWAIESLCHSGDKDQAVREAARLLKPGGRIGIAEYLRRQRPLPMEQEQTLLGWLQDWAVPDIGTEYEWRTWLEDAGFTDIRVSDITANVLPSLRHLHLMARWLCALEWLLYCLGLRTPTQHANMRGSLRQRRALKFDSWRYSIITAVRTGNCPTGS